MTARILHPLHSRAFACAIAIAIAIAVAAAAVVAPALAMAAGPDPLDVIEDVTWRASDLTAVADMPALAAAVAPDPLKLIEDETWRASDSMSAADIQAFLDAKPSYLKGYAEQDPATGRWRMASQIIYDAAQVWGVNPKVILVRLDSEQSLISAAWHTGQDIDPSSTHKHSTNYHLDWAMGCGVPTTGGRNYTMQGFSKQVWQGTMRLGTPPGPSTTTAYQWTPGKQKQVYVGAKKADGTYDTTWIVPSNQPTWNYYTYTPHYPQNAQWDRWVALFPGSTPFDIPSKRPVYRFYNLANGSHFYTASEGERWNVISRMGKTYRYEGAAYSINTSNTANSAPLYRFFNTRTKTHFYTASEAEKADIQARLASTFSFEGAAYNVSLEPSGATAVYRFFNLRNGTHFYTASEAERNDTVARLGYLYRYEGPAFYIAP